MVEMKDLKERMGDRSFCVDVGIFFYSIFDTRIIALFVNCSTLKYHYKSHPHCDCSMQH